MFNKSLKEKREYTICPPYNYSTYSPWFEDWFQEIYVKIKDYTVVTEDRCYIIYRFCQHCLHLEGDFAECGVYKGGTAFLIASTLRDNSIQNKQLHLFDTFAGMPAIADEDASGYKEGDFGDVSLTAIKGYLQVFNFVGFYQGLIPETFEVVKNRRFAFVHVDVDLYQTARDCCNFFYERMTKGGIMIFDDYGEPRFRFAEKQAVDEFFSDKPENPISLRTGQCIVIKL
jgi:O-methyltransferase